MKKRSNKGKNFVIYVIWIILIIFLFFILIESFVRPSVSSIAITDAKQTASQFINKSVNKTLTKYNSDYNNLVKIKYDTLGKISSVETNTTAINQLQSIISSDINNSFRKLKTETDPVNIGTLSGISFFNGYGPRVKFRIVPAGYVKTSLTSEFSSAGINQTLHQIKLDVTADASVLVPGHSEEFQVTTNYILTDTVIVGNIPGSYTYVTGDSRDNLSKMNDYKNSSTDSNIIVGSQ